MPVPSLMMWTPGPLELIIMLVVVMIFFGVGKLPEVGKTLGRSIREFKSAQRSGAIEQSHEESEAPSSAGVEVGASLP